MVGQLNIDGRTTKRPVVEVELTRGNYHRTFLALIDSGADQILMPAAIADGLGIDRNQCPHRSSMGITMDSIDGFVAELSIRVQHQEPFTAPVVFIDTEVPILLGREGSTLDQGPRTLAPSAGALAFVAPVDASASRLF